MQEAKVHDEDQLLIPVSEKVRKPRKQAAAKSLIKMPGGPALGVSRQTYVFVTNLAEMKGCTRMEVINKIVSEYAKSL
jgi:hypothetical protein